MSDWPQGYGRRVLTEVDSTMAEAARIGGSEFPAPTRLADPGSAFGCRAGGVERPTRVSDPPHASPAASPRQTARTRSG